MGGTAEAIANGNAENRLWERNRDDEACLGAWWRCGWCVWGESKKRDSGKTGDDGKLRLKSPDAECTPYSQQVRQ